MKSAGSGFAEYLCEYHIARRARHGHAEVPTIKGPDLKPYAEAAAMWIKSRLAQGDFRIRLSLNAVFAHLQTAGREPDARDLKTWDAEAKAKALFARLRERGVTPERILACVLGVAALLTDDPWYPHSREYRIVQIAKALHRKASGTHRQYEHPVAKREGNRVEYAGTFATTVMREYPRSQGQFLRRVGEALDEACGSLADEACTPIIAIREAKHGRHLCHTPGYEPEWRIKERAKHEAARRLRENAKREADRRVALRKALGGG